MQELVDQLVAEGLVPAGIPLWACYLAAMLLFGGIVVFVFILPIAGITTWVERRRPGGRPSRPGANRTGAAGLLQWLAPRKKGPPKAGIGPAAAAAPPPTM